MEQKPSYLGTRSDFYTHVHDLPPQLGGEHVLQVGSMSLISFLQPLAVSALPGGLPQTTYLDPAACLSFLPALCSFNTACLSMIVSLQHVCLIWVWISWLTLPVRMPSPSRKTIATGLAHAGITRWSLPPLHDSP